MKNRENIYKIILLLALFAVLYLFLNYTGRIYEGDIRRIKPHEIKKILLSYGDWSIAVFIFIYSIKPVVFFVPASVLSVVSGILYGSLFGTVYSIIGAFFAATLAFYIARFLGKDVVDRILKGKVAELDNDIEKKGFKIMLLLRLAVVFPYDALSYAAGLSKMKYRDFIAGTMLGTLPEMIAYNYLGMNIKRPFRKGTIIVFLAVIGITLISFILKSKKDKK